jgi:hypothetical protein
MISAALGFPAGTVGMAGTASEPASARLDRWANL